MNKHSLSRSLVLLGSLALTGSCQALFGGYSQGNPDNCVATPTLCRTPDEICNSETRECEAALQIDALIPSAAPYGEEVKVTLKGKNFVPNLTITVDGKPAASVTFISSSEVSAIFPASSGSKKPVPVELVSPSSQRLNRDGLFHYFPWPTFAQPVSYPCNSSPKLIRAGDFNQDGLLDLAVTGDNFAPVQIFLTQTDGTLVQAANTPIATRAFGLAVGDINGDGKLDIAASQTGPQAIVQVALGNGDGSFTLAGSVNTNATVGAMVLVDASNDRKADIALIDGTNLAVFRSLGTGMFAAPVLLAHSLQAFDVGATMTAGDLNGDGLLDLVPLNGRESRFPIYLNRGDGSFSEGNTVVDSNIVAGPVVADFNHDGRLDLAMLVKTKQLIAGFIGDGAGGFTRAFVGPTVTSADSIGIADVNGV